MTMKETRFKYTEVGMIPNDWNVIVVGECCNVYTGGECPNEWSKGKDRYFKYPIYSNGKECYGYTFDFRINKDAVCISSIGENTGDVFFYKANFTPIIRLKVIVPKNNGIDTKCLYYFLKYNRIDCTKNGGIPNINSDDVKKIKLSLPPIEEQRRIASALTSIDNLIDSLDRLIAKKRDIKQGAMQQLLSGKKRLKGFTEPWKSFKIDDLFDIGNGYTPSKANPAYWTNGTIPWFRMEDIRANGRILKDSIQHITEEAVKSSGLFPANSIILSTTATIGEHALLIADSLANQQFSFLTRKLNRCSDIDIMFFFYHCFILGEWCRTNINDGGLMAVNMNDLKNYTFPAPSLPEQQAIASVLTTMDNELSALEAKRKKYEQIKQGMMQQLLTGKIRLIC